MAKPMFFYVGIYHSATDAEADCDAIKALNDSGAIGSYDSAVLVKEADGDVKVTKTEKPAEHGAWVGVAAGAGAALGAWFAHLAHGTSRGELKRIGETLGDGDAAVVVIGIDHDAESIEAAATRSREHVLSRAVGDWDAAEEDALAALKKAEGAPA